MTQFLKQHERLILGLVALAVTLFLWNKWINSAAANAAERNAVAQHELQAQRDITAQRERESAQRDLQYQQTLALVTQQIQGLQNAMNTREAQLGKQREADKVMPLPTLAHHWEGLIGITGDIQNVNNQLVVGETASRETVQQLDAVPVLQQDLKDDAAIIGKREEQIGKLTDAYQSCQARAVSLDDQSKKQDVACKAEVANIKALARKGKRNWFVTGLFVGAGIVAKFLW